MSEDPNARPVSRLSSDDEMASDASADRAEDRDQNRPDVPSEDDARLDDSEYPREYGGRRGPDPVRYGDWEKGGQCIDF